MTAAMREISPDTDPNENSLAVKGPNFARAYIARLEAENPNRNARKRMAELASGPLGNYTPEGKAVWREYLATFTR